MIDKKCVVIGGGTGSFGVLKGLKGQVRDLTAIVSMADDGGSTGILRDELGVLPPGDVRQCLVALSDASDELRDLFNFRFSEGGFEGHSFGNIFLSAVEKQTADFGQAVRMASDVLNIRGTVLPITLNDVRLKISWRDGTTVRGEGEIDTMHFADDKGLPKLQLEPKATINPEAEKALLDANLIVIAPGDLYTSLGPLLIVDGVKEALANTKATVVYVCNLVSKPGQTNDMTVADHAAEIERFAGGQVLDFVLYNTGQPEQALFERYAKTGELLVDSNKAQFASAHYKAIGADLLAHDEMRPTKVAGDKLAAHRSFIRHNGGAIAKALHRF